MMNEIVSTQPTMFYANPFNVSTHQLRCVQFQLDSKQYIYPHTHSIQGTFSLEIIDFYFSFFLIFVFVSFKRYSIQQIFYIDFFQQWIGGFRVPALINFSCALSRKRKTNSKSINLRESEKKRKEKKKKKLLNTDAHT